MHSVNTLPTKLDPHPSKGFQKRSLGEAFPLIDSLYLEEHGFRNTACDFQLGPKPLFLNLDGDFGTTRAYLIKAVWGHILWQKIGFPVIESS